MATPAALTTTPVGAAPLPEAVPDAAAALFAAEPEAAAWVPLLKVVEPELPDPEPEADAEADAEAAAISPLLMTDEAREISAERTLL